MKLNIQTNSIAKTGTITVQKVYADGTAENREDIVICEHLLRVFVNERQMVQLVCTPTNLTELVLGWLLTEGIITDVEDVESLNLCETGNEARVVLQKDCVARKPLEKLPEQNWKRESVFALAQVFAEDSKLHRETKGTHSCYLSVNGEYVFHSEDIGRHNAMDKCIGYAVQKGIDRKDCILFTTGRVPTDMVQKAIVAGIPVLVSKAVPTDAAIRLAAEYGLTLICKAWPDSYELCLGVADKS